MRVWKIGMMLLFLLLLAQLASAASVADPERIISNSADWRDVYSVMLYGSLLSKPVNFLVSEKHGALLVNSIAPNARLWVISSKKVPYTTGYNSYLEGKGFTVENFEYDSVNLEIAKRLSTKSFLIVDDSYGYNAISVAPYAVASSSYVLFADEKNIDKVDSFLSGRNPTKVLIYGHVDRAVKNALSKYNPETINKDGDRFANNIEIVKRYQELSHSKQVVLTNGEFIENEIMQGQEPVIFIGRNNVPDIVRSYISDSGVTVGVLIGNELVNTATFIRRQVGISVFVKYARSARQPTGSVSQVEGLDAFYLPTYSLNLEIDSLTYNKANKQLEVVLRNTQDQAAYFKGTYTLTSQGGAKLTVGDADAIFIEPNSFKTVTYALEGLDESAAVGAYIIYGESRNSLEKVISEQYCLSCEKKFSAVDIIDSCDMNMTQLSYNVQRKTFLAEVTNIGKIGCYADIELADVVVAGEKVTYHLKDVAFLDSSETKALKIKGGLEREDLGDNQLVDVKLFYGQRQNSLTKLIEKRFPLLEAAGGSPLATAATYAAMGMIGMAGIFFAWKIFAGPKLLHFLWKILKP